MLVQMRAPYLMARDPSAGAIPGQAIVGVFIDNPPFIGYLGRAYAESRDFVGR